MTEKQKHDDGFYHIPVKQMTTLLQAMQTLIFYLEKEHPTKHNVFSCRQCYAINLARKIIRGEQ